MTAELLDEGPDDDEMVTIVWLQGVLASGKPISNVRRIGDPLPAIVVAHVSGTECLEESYVDDVVAVHMLWPRDNDSAVARRTAVEGCNAIHRRMLLLGRYLEDVNLPGGRKASIDYLDVFMRPEWVPYGDQQILQKVAQYRLGLDYAKMS